METPEYDDFDVIIKILEPATEHELKSILRVVGMSNPDIAKAKPDRDDPIIKILEAAESSHELKWILRNAQEKIKISSDSSYSDKGNALEEGIKRVLEFGMGIQDVKLKYNLYKNKIGMVLDSYEIY